MSRYIIIIDTRKQPLSEARKSLEDLGARVVDEMSMINTLVVEGSADCISTLTDHMNSIISIEEEGEVSTQLD
jgi:hypothetical protein